MAENLKESGLSLGKQVSFDTAPIFIIGAARSGTKFLRDCLKSDPRVFAVPYDVNYIWRHGQPIGGSDIISPTDLTERQCRFIQKSLAKQAGLRPGGVLLEKTVSNSLRVPFVEAVFPGARYIHLVRDGRHVAASAMKEWTSAPDFGRLFQKLVRVPFASFPYLFWYARNALRSKKKQSRVGTTIWGPRYPRIIQDAETRTLAEVCAIQWQNSVETALNDLQAIPSMRVFQIHYEDLVRNKSEIECLADALGLDVAVISKTWEATVRSDAPHNLSESEKATRAKITSVVAETLSVLDYI